MTGQPGLFDLPELTPAPTVRAPRDRGRRGEHWTRSVVADLHVVDERALRDAAHRRLSDAVTIDLGPADDPDADAPDDDDPDADVLDPYEEIAASAAAAVCWWTEPTTGTWPQLAEALRLDGVELEATNTSPHRVRAHWSVTVTITDIALLRTQASGQGSADETFPGLWNRAADPFAPLAGLPGVTWAPGSVEVFRGR